jgi:hypothetical protein
MVNGVLSSVHPLGKFQLGYRPWSRPFGPVHDHYISSVNAHVHEAILSGDDYLRHILNRRAALGCPPLNFTKTKATYRLSWESPSTSGVEVTQRNIRVRTTLGPDDRYAERNPIDYFANAFELFLSLSKRSNSALRMQ